MAATKIMIIRHAEKPSEDGLTNGVNMSGTKDPEDLIVRGWQRAGALLTPAYHSDRFACRQKDRTRGGRRRMRRSARRA